MLAEYITKIDDMLCNSEHRSKFIAVGECGLDYDRFEYANKAEQLLAFSPHFDLA